MKSSHKKTTGVGKTPLRGEFRPTVVSCEVDKKVSDCIGVIFDLLTIYGMVEDSSTSLAFRNTCRFWRAQTARMNDDWIGYSKFKLAYFVHSVTEQLAPPPSHPEGISREDGHRLIQGKAGAYLARLLKLPIRDELIASIGLGVKRGMPRPDKSYLTRGATKAYVALTTERPPQPDISSLDLRFRYTDWADVPDDLPNYEDELSRTATKRHVRRIVHELFFGTDFLSFVSSKGSRPFPSTSSTSTSTRGQGGGFSDVQASAEALGLIGPAPLMDLTMEVDDEETVLRKLGMIGEDGPRDVFDSFLADPTRLHLKYDMLYNNIRDAYRKGQLDNEVDIVALSEALKVRTITKGNGLRNFLLAPLQQFLWSRISNHPIFTLIGKPLEEVDVLNSLGTRLNDGRAFLSADFSGATDNVCPWLSDMIAEEISEVARLPPYMTKLFKEALTGHMVRNPDGTGILPQRWGQLMGSVVSFPILCIANAIVCRWTIEFDLKRTVPLNQLKLLINGDDALLRIKPSSLPIWETVSRFHGLIPSVGKFFLSFSLIQMNSINFVLDSHLISDTRPDGVPIERLCPYRMVKYVNLGLFYGLGRSSASLTRRHGEDVEDQVKVEDVVHSGSRARDLLRACPTPLVSTLFERYFAFHKANFARVASTLPWFVPQSFGGLGLPSFVEVPDPVGSPENHERYLKLHRLGLVFPADRPCMLRFAPTRLDCRTVGAIMDSGRTPGPIKMDSTLPIREVASQYIPVTHVIGESSLYDGEAVMAQACLEVLFRKRLSVKEFVGSIEKVLARRGFGWQGQQSKKLGSERSVFSVLENSLLTFLPIRLFRIKTPYRFPHFVAPFLKGWGGEDLGINW